MVGTTKLVNPWLVAVWPGMGKIADSAGYYLMAKLDMTRLAEFSPHQLFDIEYVEVKNGIIHPGHLPRSRFFYWQDPGKKRDIVVFIGEAQPPIGKYGFCHQLIRFALALGVCKVVTFAAMATQTPPRKEARVFAAATDKQSLQELRQFDTVIVEDGLITGLNGALLGVAAENGLDGICLMGEVPMHLVQFPYPKGSFAVLNTFCRMADIAIDLNELKQEADTMSAKLSALYGNFEHALGLNAREQSSSEEREQKEEELGLDPGDQQRIEHLFENASKDRSKAYELKAELDRLHVFDSYEDRFLDLFKAP